MKTSASSQSEFLEKVSELMEKGEADVCDPSLTAVRLSMLFPLCHLLSKQELCCNHCRLTGTGTEWLGREALIFLPFF